jgi:tetratricopeptide (TPR) repeat protein
MRTAGYYYPCFVIGYPLDQTTAYMNATAFISYSWDAEQEKNEEWVLRLAEQLKADGIDVLLDKWAVKPGDPIAPFMQQAIAKSDKVLMVCTPRYKRSADDGKGAAGYESNIIAAQIWLTADHRKFIAIVKEGNEQTAVPFGLQGKCHIFFNEETRFEAQYQVLLAAIKNDAVPAVAARDIPALVNSNPKPDFNNLSFAVLKALTKKQIDEYIAYYRKSIIANTSNDHAFFGLGLCALHYGLYDIAIRQLEKASMLSPSNPEYRYYYALSLTRGRSLSAIPDADIKTMTNQIEIAVQFDGQQAKYYAFLWIIHQSLQPPADPLNSPPDLRLLQEKSRQGYRDEYEIERLVVLLGVIDAVLVGAILGRQV